jgi:hypothetical protein
MPARSGERARSAERGLIGSCDILNLVLGPLHLDLLGLVIDLNQVVLNITGTTGSRRPARQPVVRDYRIAGCRQHWPATGEPAQSTDRSARRSLVIKCFSLRAIPSPHFFRSPIPLGMFRVFLTCLPHIDE